MLTGVYIDLDVFDPDRVGRKKGKEGFELSYPVAVTDGDVPHNHDHNHSEL